MELTEDDVFEILKLFEQSKFDFLQLQEGEHKITVSKGGFVPTGAENAPPPAPAAAPVAPAPQAAAIDPGLVPVTAPMVGMFYSAASPSDPPYVEVGTQVEASATVGLIELMKVFTSIKTKMAGVIEKILVTNGQYVEFGQTLFLMRPHGGKGTE
jgi:acetyl-CoA carboxylase biotin carboxyl carrier protein